MNRERIDLWCERGMLGLVLAIMVFGPLAAGAVHTISFLILQGLACLLIPLWLTRLWLVPDRRIFWPPVCWVVLAFAGYAVARYFTADLEWVARQELIRVLVYALVFLTLVVFLNSTEHAKVICLTMVFLAMGVAMYAVYQYVTESERVWHLVSPYKDRGKGTYINPNHLAGFLEMLLPVGLALTLMSRLKVTVKVFVGYASLMILAGIGASLSRGSWIACGIALLLFFVVVVSQRHFWIQGVLLLLVVGCAAGLFIKRSFEVRKRFDDLVMSGKPGDNRFDLWKPAYEMWRENFWFGVGPDHYDFRFRAYRPQSVQTQPDHAHNDYLNTLADWGTTGAVLVSLAIGLVLAGALKTFGALGRAAREVGSGRSTKRAIVLGAATGVVASLVHAMVDFNMQIPANAILFVTLLALLTGHLKFATGRFQWRGSNVWRILCTVALAGLLSFLGFQEWKRAKEYAWLRRAEAELHLSPGQLDCLKRAFEVEPTNFQTAHWIGECYRAHSMEGFEDYEELGRQAIQWYETSAQLNPFNGDTYLHHGMCLDWLNRFDESKSLYIKALERDPNGSFTSAMLGWHYIQLGKYAAAKPWFERSRALLWQEAVVSEKYLALIERRLKERAASERGLLDLLSRPPDSDSDRKKDTTL